MQTLRLKLGALPLAAPAPLATVPPPAHERVVDVGQRMTALFSDEELTACTLGHGGDAGKVIILLAFGGQLDPNSKLGRDADPWSAATHEVFEPSWRLTEEPTIRYLAFDTRNAWFWRSIYVTSSWAHCVNPRTGERYRPTKPKRKLGRRS